MNFNPQVIGIMATTQQGIIGCKNSLPWNYPDELEYFRKTIANHIIVMGRKTYEAIPKSLIKKRHVIIFSQNPNLLLKSVKIVHSLNEYLKYVRTLHVKKTIFIIGGAEIAHLFLKNNLISSFILTKIHKSYTGDTYLDLAHFEGWPGVILESRAHYTIFQLTNPKKKSI